MSLNDLDFESSDFFLNKKDKHPWGSVPRLQDVSSLTTLDKVTIAKVLKTPLPIEPKLDLESLNVPSSVPMIKVKSSNNAAPKVTKKLPAAFSTFTKSAWSSEKKKSFGYNFFNPNQEPVDAIEQMVNAQEYKYTKGLLSPIQPPAKTPKRTEEPKVRTIFSFKEEKFKNIMNPLGPLRELKEYMALPKARGEEVNGSFDLSVQRPRKPHRVYTETKQSPKDAQAPKSLNLNEMVTLQIIKSSHATGVVKKMLHAPSLRLFAVKEVPLTTRESRNLLKQWVDQWQSVFGNSRYHLKIFTTYFNVPEGCLSIITELTNAGSLQNLTETMGSLPEMAIKSISKQLLKALNAIHTKLRVAHGVVCPSQVLLDKNGDVKLSMGLADKLQPQNNGGFQWNGISRNTFEKFNFLDKPSNTLPNFAQKGFLGQKSPKNNDETQQQAIAQDIFDFGWLMLKCAVGDLEFFGEADFSLKLKIFLDEYNKRPEERHHYCCVLHDEDLISSINPAFPDYDVVKFRSKKASRKEKFQLGFKDLLSASNFSQSFVDFLCACLRFDPGQRFSASSLLTSPFIKSSKVQGPSTSLVELLKLSTQAPKDVILPAQYQAASEKHLEKLCSALAMIWSQSSVMSKPSDDEMDIRRLQYMNANSMAIQDLAFELGLPAGKVFKHLKGLIQEI